MKIELSLTFVLWLVLVTPFVLGETVSSSSPTVKTFVQSVGGGGRLVSAVQGGNGTYVSLSAHTDKDFLIRKTRYTGEKVWERKLHLDVDYPITLEGIAQTSDGGYILAGWGEVCDGYYCYYGPPLAGILVKLASNGRLIWKKTYSRVNTVAFTSVVSASDGGFVATNKAEDHFEVVKFTSAGDVVWSRTIIDPAVGGWQLIPTFDNGYILTSNRRSLVSHVIKLNDSGAIVWTKSLEAEGLLFTTTALGTSDGGVVLGFMGRCSRCNQISLIGLQQDGTISWKATYALTLSTIRSSTAVTGLIETTDHGYAILGKSFLLKIDSSKKVVFNTEKTSFQLGSDGWIFNSPDGGFLTFEPLLNITKVDSNGIVPGCLDSSVPVSRLPRGALKAGAPSISLVSDNLSLAVQDIAGTSTASNLPVITRCP